MYVINYCDNQLNIQNHTNHKKEKTKYKRKIYKYYINKKEKKKERKNVSGRWDSNRH